MTSDLINGSPSSGGIRNDEASTLIESVRDSMPSDGSFDRKRLKDLALKLSIALETPGETAQRIAYLVSLHSDLVDVHLHSRKARNQIPNLKTVKHYHKLRH